MPKAALSPALLNALRGVQVQAEAHYATPEAAAAPLGLAEAARQWLADATPSSVLASEHRR